MTMIGIDPHKATHTAVAVDGNEHVVDEFQLRASSRQAERLRAWADSFAEREWAVESANGLGYLVAQQLVAAGEVVFDVPPVLASRVRVLGSGHSQKNDPNDARSVAIAAMRSDRLARSFAPMTMPECCACWPNDTATWPGYATSTAPDCTRCCSSWNQAGSAQRSPSRKQTPCSTGSASPIR